MSGRIPPSFIDELLVRVDIVELIESRIPLRKTGRDFSARCPFHDERSASFTVSPTKQFYHCFGCGAHGGAIKFLMDYDRLEFTDAVEELASRIGLKVPYEASSRLAQTEDGKELYKLLQASAEFFRQELTRSDQARGYAHKRGLSTEMLTLFGIGYAPDQWEALKSTLGTNPQRIALLEKSGMLITGERGSKYDRFRHRLMFPIQDRRGRVIAFGGRVLDNGTPKYLNSPETSLFHKGRELFGLWQVRQAHIKIPRLLVVEGYMDVVALFRHGLPQAVATLGTATTAEHAELLFRNCHDVYFCFDGDRAGRSAAWRAVESILPRLRDGRQAYFLFLPEGEDPDSLIHQEGQTGFEKRLASAMPLSEFFFSEQSKNVNLSSIDGKARLTERCRPLLLQIPDGAFRDLMLKQLDDLTGVQIRLESQLPSLKPVSPLTASTGRTTLVRTAISLLIQNPSVALSVEVPYGFSTLNQSGVSLLIELLDFCRVRPEITTGLLLEHFSSRPEEKILSKLAIENYPGEDEELRSHFLGAIIGLIEQTQKQRRDEIEEKIRTLGLSSLSTEEKDELRSLKLQLGNRINRQ